MPSTCHGLHINSQLNLTHFGYSITCQSSIKQRQYDYQCHFVMGWSCLKLHSFRRGDVSGGTFKKHVTFMQKILTRY